jgi:hypothetical protein
MEFYPLYATIPRKPKQKCSRSLRGSGEHGNGTLDGRIYHLFSVDPIDDQHDAVVVDLYSALGGFPISAAGGGIYSLVRSPSP